MVEVTKDYVFKGGSGGARNVPGTATLLDMFQGRRQLIVDHYMFDPNWEDGCPSCAGRVDQYGNLEHLHDRDTTIAVFHTYSAYGAAPSRSAARTTTST